MGGQAGGVETVTAHLHAAISHQRVDERPPYQLIILLLSLTALQPLGGSPQGVNFTAFGGRTTHHLTQWHFSFLSGTPKLDSVGMELMKGSIFFLLTMVV